MSRSQYHRAEKCFSRIRLDTFYFVVFNNQRIHPSLEMDFAATFDDCIPHIFNDTRQFICSDMRMRVCQYRRRRSMLAKYIQYFVYISSFLAAGIELSVRIGSCSPFAKTVI